jgi:hypothetical protein
MQLAYKGRLIGIPLYNLREIPPMTVTDRGILNAGFISSACQNNDI